MNTFPGLVHTARHVTKVGNTRSRWPNRKEGAVEGGIRDWGEVVSKLRPWSATTREKLGLLLGTPEYPALLVRLTSDNATGADNQQGSRTAELSSVVLTLQRLNAEPLEETIESIK